MEEPENPYWIMSMSPQSGELEIRSSDGDFIATIHPHKDAARNAAIITAAPGMHRLLGVSAEFLTDLSNRSTGLLQEIAGGLAPSLTATLDQVETATMIARTYGAGRKS